MPNPEALTHMTNSPKQEKLTQEELKERMKKKFQALEPTIKEEVDKYKKALKEGEFEDEEGEKKKEEMQNRITALIDKAEKMKATLDSGEILPDSTETIEDPTLTNSFLLATFKSWGVNQDKLDTLHFSPELVLPEDLDYSTKKTDIDETKFGEYTLNPETYTLDYDSIPEDKIKIITLPNTLNGKPLDEIANHILQTYPNHKIPGLDYYQYILENPSKAPGSLKDSNFNFHFFFGSLFRGSGGRWGVPSVRWYGSRFSRDGYWLGRSWNVNYRVVLLEP